MERKHYRLRAPWGAFVLFLMFIGGGTAITAYEWATNVRPLTINGIIHLDSGDARTFYGVMAMLGLALVVSGTRIMIRLSRGTMEVVIDQDTIAVPRLALFKKVVIRRIPFAEITDVYIETLKSAVLLQIVTKDDKVGISKAHLIDAEFEEIVAAIAERVPAERTRRSSLLPLPETRRERPMVHRPLPGPPKGVETDPFRAPPATEIRVTRTAPEPEAPPVAYDPDAPGPTLLR